MATYDPAPALRAIDAIAPEIVKLGPKPPWAAGHAAFQWHDAASAAAAPLRHTLEAMPPFNQWHNAMLNVGAGSNGVQPMILAPRLAELVADEGVEFAKTVLVQLLTTESAEASWITVAWSFDVCGELDLGDGLSVSLLTEEENHRRYDQWTVPWHVRLQQRPAVFKLPFTVSPVLYKMDEAPDAPDSTVAMATQSRARDEVLALSALGTASSLIEEQYVSFSDPHLAALALGGKYNSLAELVPTRRTEPIKLDQDAKTYLEAFRRLKLPLRVRILTILDRLGAAKRRSSPTNQALDACIALEMLLTGKSDAQGGIINRLGTRAALFLGQTLEERRRLRKSVSAAYTLRSRAAHGGTGDKDGDDEVAVNAIDIANRLVQKIVESGNEVDWPTLELNPPPLRVATSAAESKH